MSETKYTTERGILNCGVRFDFVCSQTWLEMEPGEDARKRFCTSCKRDVFWCHDVNEAALRAEQGECIAVPSAMAEGWPEENGIVIVGQGSFVRSQLERSYQDLVGMLENE